MPFWTKCFAYCVRDVERLLRGILQRLGGIMKAKLALLSLVALVLFVLPAKTFADQLTFNLTGTFAQLANPAITGNFAATITIDNTAGDVVSFEVTTPGHFGGPCFASPDCSPGPLIPDVAGYSLAGVDAHSDELEVSISQSSLVGITTLTLKPGSFWQFQDFTDASDSACYLKGSCVLNNLTISPAVPAPEPNTLLLSGIGLAALALLGMGRAKLGRLSSLR
jgi:hypothetical protein